MNRFLRKLKEEQEFILSISQVCLLSTYYVSCIARDPGGSRRDFSGEEIDSKQIRLNKLAKYIWYVVINAMEKNKTVKDDRHLAIFKVG